MSNRHERRKLNAAEKKLRKERIKNWHCRHIGLSKKDFLAYVKKHSTPERPLVTVITAGDVMGLVLSANETCFEQLRNVADGERDGNPRECAKCCQGLTAEPGQRNSPSVLALITQSEPNELPQTTLGTFVCDTCVEYFGAESIATWLQADFLKEFAADNAGKVCEPAFSDNIRL
ncbi:hypothetical protein [Falsiphaeobacter marinintestinus]|uniref:hypothetical protein n=1 Tax=Falsiphaeobacter marinintestinus TaxID=1492905 RepID=UPI0011B5B743|nr:hypothetical protein [Phaeobacter marinintestinus]